MNPRKTFLILAALGIAVAALVYLNFPRGAGVGAGGAGEEKQTATAKAAAGDAAAPQADRGVTRAAESVAEENAALPVPGTRKPGELTDALPVGVAGFSGKPLVAAVRVDERWTPELAPNQVGEFPRVYVKLNQKVSIRLRFPEAEPGARASVSVEDGGFVADRKPALPLVLDEKREGEFDFTTGGEPGRYRVVVRQGADVRFVVLWAEA